MTLRSTGPLTLAVLIAAAFPSVLRAQPARPPVPIASPAHAASRMHFGERGGPAYTITGPVGWDRQNGASVWTLGKAGLFAVVAQRMTAANPDAEARREIAFARAHGFAVVDEGSLTLCGQPAHRWTERRLLPNGEAVVVHGVTMRLTKGIAAIEYARPASTNDRPEALAAIRSICDAP